MDANSRVEAFSLSFESMQAYRMLSESHPRAYLPDLAISLSNLSERFSERGDAASRAQAFLCAREAVQILSLFHATMPAAFERWLSIAISNLRDSAVKNDLDPDVEVAAALGGQET
jgi:hypothetical protein